MIVWQSQPCRTQSHEDHEDNTKSWLVRRGKRCTVGGATANGQHINPSTVGGGPQFAARWRRGDWQDEICLRFGNWLNAAISTDRTPMGQAEAEAWQTALDDELRMIRLELADHD